MAQTTPSRLTTVAHMSRLKPPFGCRRAAVRAARRALYEGSWLQEEGASLWLLLAAAAPTAWEANKVATRAKGSFRDFRMCM
jgi:hypothetical protein